MEHQVNGYEVTTGIETIKTEKERKMAQGTKWHGAKDDNYSLTLPSDFLQNYGMPLIAQKIIQDLSEKSGYLKFLILGVYEGRDMHYLLEMLGSLKARYGFKGSLEVDITAVDIKQSAWHVEIARQKYPQAEYLLVDSFADLDLTPNQYDYVIWWRGPHVIIDESEHVRMFMRINYLLKDGGALLLATRFNFRHNNEPTSFPWRGKVMELSNGAGGTRVDYYHTIQSLIDLCGNAYLEYRILSTIKEGEVVDGKTVLNDYLVGYFQKQHRISDHFLQMYHLYPVASEVAESE